MDLKNGNNAFAPLEVDPIGNMRTNRTITAECVRSCCCNCSLCAGCNFYRAFLTIGGVSGSDIDSGALTDVGVV